MDDAANSAGDDHGRASFRASLWTYVEEVIALLRVEERTHPGAVVRGGWLQWAPEPGSAYGSTSPTVYVRRARGVQWSLTVGERIERLPGRALLLQELQENPVTRNQLDVLVGTRLGASTRQSETLLWTAVQSGVKSADELVLDDTQFERYVERLEREFFDAERTATVLTPLAGFDSNVEAIEFPAGLSLDRLTDDELVRCLEVGLLRPDLPGPGDGYYAPTVRPWGIRYQWKEPKRIGALDPADLGDLPIDAARESIRRALTSLRLLQTGVVTPIAEIQYVEFGPGMSWSILPVRPPGRQPYVLAAQRAIELVDLWVTLGLRDVQQHAAIQNALTRLAFASERYRPEDALVDLMIAAESLFLSDLDRRDGELRFRMSLRAGWLLGNDWSTRLETYRQFRNAYDVRSDIVHGNPLDPKTMPGGLPAFLEAIEAQIREALRRVVSELARTGRIWTPANWDELVMGTGATTHPRAEAG